MTLQIQGINDFEEVNGEVKIKEVNNHDLEDDFEVSTYIFIYLYTYLLI